MSNIPCWSPENGDILSDAELVALTRRGENTGIISGCNIAAAGTPNLTLVVDAGVIVYNNTRVVCAGATLNFTSLVDPTFPKICVVYIDTAGVPRIHAGVGAAIVPVNEADWKDWQFPYPAPSIPAGAVIAKIKLDAAEANITTSDIYAIAQKCVVGATYALEFCFHNNGQVLIPGTCPGLEVPITGTIIAATLMSADSTSGSISVAVWKANYAASPPVVGGIIDTYVVSTNTKSQETGLSIAVTAGDWITPNIGSVTSFKVVTLSLLVSV